MKLTPEKRLVLTLSITLFILFAEVLGGLLSNSLALLSDAGHVLTDAFALGLEHHRCADKQKTVRLQGNLRLPEGGSSCGDNKRPQSIGHISFHLLESYHRFISPPSINTSIMLPVAIGGLIGNIVMAVILGSGHHDLNIKSAWLHVFGDTLSSVGVIISGIIVYLTGWTYADPIAGILIGIIIISGGIRVVKEATSIFLELVPKGFDVEDIARRIAELPEVMGIHDIHIWSLTHKRVSFSAHIWVHDQKLSELEPLRKKIEDMLQELEIRHILLQFECAECETNGLYCQLHTMEEYEDDHHH